MGLTIAIIGFAIWPDLTGTQLLNHTIKTRPTVCIQDGYGKPYCARVNVQGVLMEGVVDSGAGITIVDGNMFKHVAVVAKLRKNFKPSDKVPRNYDQQQL